MKKLFAIDDRTSSRSAIFDQEIKTVEEGYMIWNALSEYDQNHCDAFFVLEGEVDEEGMLDWNTAETIVTIK